MKLYKRPILSLAVLLAVCVLCVLFLQGIRVGESLNVRFFAYTIRFEYFGIDAAEIERLITIPLEEKISSMNGIFEMRSISEYGSSMTTVYFEKNIKEKNVYLDLREAVDSLYAVLPSSVQKPRIYSASTDQKPILIFSLQSSLIEIGVLRRIADNELKPSIESIEGVAEVLVSGGSIEEIKIFFDAQKIIAGNINPNTLGIIIQDANVLSPGGTIRNSFQHEQLLFNTRITHIDEIRKLPVPVKNGIVNLEYIADVNLQPRLQDEIVRINQQEGIAISVKSSGNGNSVDIAKQCKKLLEQYESNDVSISILHDNGEVVADMIQHIFYAVIGSFLLVVILLPFFFRSLRTVLLLIVILPFSVLCTATVLHQTGYIIDQNVLAGISIALGLIADCALIIAEIAESIRDRKLFYSAVCSAFPSMISSTITTILVLVPLYFFDYMVPGIRSVVITIIVMLLSSLLFSIFFLPVFIYKPPHTKAMRIMPAFFFRCIHRFYTRITYRISFWSIRHSKKIVFLYVACAIVPFILFAFLGKNTNLDYEDSVLPLYIEFESEKSAHAVDIDTQSFMHMIEKIDGVKTVRAEAKKGVAEGSVQFDQNTIGRGELARSIDRLSDGLFDGFLYIPDLVQSDLERITEIEIAVIGDDSYKCREIAQQAVRGVGSHYDVEQTVLNFKKPEKTISFIPDRDILEKNGISISAVAGILRWILFGPVVDKWIQDNRETDIRIAGKNLQEARFEELAQIYIPTASKGLPLSALGEICETENIGKIYRKDGRRAAYFTVHMRSSSTDKAVHRINEILAEIETERGYGFSLSRSLVLLQTQYDQLLYIFIFCIIGILILLTALTENPVRSCIIVSVIPVSVLLPLAIRAISGTALSMGDIIGMIMVSGISVNNAIYITESRFKNIVYKVRNKVQSILVTTISSMSSGIPLLLLGGEGFSGDLGFFMVWGTMGSVCVTMSMYPGIVKRITDKNWGINILKED